MSFGAEELLDRLRCLQDPATGPARYVVAFSGGLDSSVLLECLVRGREHYDIPLLAVYVDHGLHPDSARWAGHCASIARGSDVEFLSLKADLRSSSGSEEAARDARYRVLETCVQKNDWLLCAHHADDQAETLLLNLMRGSGPDGLAGMRAIRPFGPAYLVRPLLGVSRETLRQFAVRSQLQWLDDPSNADSRFDRNFLRNELLPFLETRWPAARAKLARSASLARDASDLLEELADLDFAAIPGPYDRLPAALLRELSPARCANLLRQACRRLGLPVPPATRLAEIQSSLIDARADAKPRVQWRGAEVRRYRDTVYLLGELPRPDFDGASLVAGTPLPLGPGLGQLALGKVAGQGLDPVLVDAGLTLRSRKGGESIKLSNHKHTSKLKNLLHEKGVLPWQRDRLPLLYSGRQLVAVADLWVAAEAQAEGGYRVTWEGRPVLT